MREKNIFLQHYIIFLFIFILPLAIGPRFSEGAEDAYGFDDRFTYDIYLRTKDDLSSVVRKIAIEGFREIGAKTFLVIKSTGFRFKDAQGFVSLDSVVAILPTDELRIHEGQKIQTQF